MVSNQNETNYLDINNTIPEGVRITTIDGKRLSIVVQNPLSLNTDVHNVIKLSLDYSKLAIGNIGFRSYSDKEYYID